MVKAGLTVTDQSDSNNFYDFDNLAGGDYILQVQIVKWSDVSVHDYNVRAYGDSEVEFKEIKVSYPPYYYTPLSQLPGFTQSANNPVNLSPLNTLYPYFNQNLLWNTNSWQSLQWPN